MVIDILIAVIVLAALITGAITGLVRQLGTLVAFVVAILSCRFFGPSLCSALIPADTGHPVLLSGCVYFGLFVVAYLVVVLIARLLHATVNALQLGFVNRILGALFRVVLWLVIASACVNAAIIVYPSSRSEFENPAKPWRGWVVEAAPKIVGFIANT